MKSCAGGLKHTCLEIHRRNPEKYSRRVICGKRKFAAEEVD